MILFMIFVHPHCENNMIILLLFRVVRRRHIIIIVVVVVVVVVVSRREVIPRTVQAAATNSAQPRKHSRIKIIHNIMECSRGKASLSYILYIIRCVQARQALTFQKGSSILGVLPATLPPYHKHYRIFIHNKIVEF